jgi:hypothetical protein
MPSRHPPSQLPIATRDRGEFRFVNRQRQLASRCLNTHERSSLLRGKFSNDFSRTGGHVGARRAGSRTLGHTCPLVFLPQIPAPMRHPA